MTPAATPSTPFDPREMTPPRRIGEATLALAVAEWLAGADFPAQDACWVPYAGSSVLIRQDGDTLSHRGHVVATRSPPAVVRGSFRADISNARAVCSVALRGAIPLLYPRAA